MSYSYKKLVEELIGSKEQQVTKSLIKQLTHTKETETLTSGGERKYELPNPIENTNLKPDMREQMELEEKCMVSLEINHDNLLPFFIKELGLDENNLPFQIMQNPTGYSMFWDTESKKFIKQAVDCHPYLLKDFEMEEGFASCYKLLHPIQKKEFLDDVWQMFMNARFKYVYTIFETRVNQQAYTLGIRGILERDYDEAAGVRKKAIIDKLMEKHGIKKEEIITSEDLKTQFQLEDMTKNRTIGDLLAKATPKHLR